jgi:hypothetical protein
MKTHLESKFLGAFAKLRKATINFVVSIRLSAWNNSVPNGRIFMKFDIWAFLENVSRKFKLHYNRPAKRLLYMKTNIHLLYSAKSSKNKMFQTKFVQEITFCFQ